MERTFRKLQQKLGALTPRQFELLLIVILGIIFFITLFSAQTIRPYSSDDVTTQAIVQSWEHSHKLNAVVGQDTYIIKIPFFALQDILEPHNSQTKLFVEALVFNAVLFAGVIYFTRSLLTTQIWKSRLNLALAYLPMGWYLALAVTPLASNRSFNFMCPDFRNAELGIALLVSGVLFKFLRPRIGSFTQKRTIGLIVLLCLLAIFLSDDPYFVYMLALPALLLTFILWLNDKINLRRAITLAVYIGACIIGSEVVSKIVEKAGLATFQYVLPRFIDVSQLWATIATTIGADFNQLGANIWAEPLSKSLVPEILNCALVVLCAWAVIQTVQSLRLHLETRRLFLALVVLLNALIFILNPINNPANARFILFGVVAEVLLLSVFGASIKNRKWRLCLAALYILAIFVNVGVNVRSTIFHYADHDPNPNAINYEIVNAVKKQGLTKGYAPYWSSLINTYFSSSKINFLPVTCNNKHLEKLDWVVNKPDFNIPATKTFYLYSNDTLLPNVVDCSINTLVAKPVKTIKINSTYTLYIFNQDIGTPLKSTAL